MQRCVVRSSKHGKASEGVAVSLLNNKNANAKLQHVSLSQQQSAKAAIQLNYLIITKCTFLEPVERA